MKYLSILFILICLGCKKDEPTIEAKSKQPIELVTDSTTDNQNTHD